MDDFYFYAIPAHYVENNNEKIQISSDGYDNVSFTVFIQL